MIIIALGANLTGPKGPPKDTMLTALTYLEAENVEVCSVSDFWETEPWPVSDQPWYVNAVAVVETQLSPQELLALCHEIEKKCGRDRSKEQERNAPRVLDLDLISYGNEVMDEKGMVLPHPRMHERAFVLQPLNQVAPNWLHPVLKKTPMEMIENMNQKQNIIRLYEGDICSG